MFAFEFARKLVFKDQEFQLKFQGETTASLEVTKMAEKAPLELQVPDKAATPPLPPPVETIPQPPVPPAETKKPLKREEFESMALSAQSDEDTPKAHETKLAHPPPTTKGLTDKLRKEWPWKYGPDKKPDDPNVKVNKIPIFST